MTAQTPEASRRLRHEEVDLVLSPFALLPEQAVQRIVRREDLVSG